jgi:hypothetical protein
METRAEAAINNLKDVKKILNKEGIVFWLEAGTLLLAYRDKKIDETDIDISVYSTLNLIPIMDKFTNEGFEVHHILGSGEATEITLERDGVKLDIWPKLFRDGQVWWAAYSDRPIPQHVDERHCRTLDTLEIWGEKWNIPHDVEGYLEANYGDWRTPNPDWNWAVDPISIDYNWEIG